MAVPAKPSPVKSAAKTAVTVAAPEAAVAAKVASPARKSGGRSTWRAPRVSGGSGSQKLLIAEFVICLILLALSPLTKPDVGAKDWMKKGTGIALVFIILGFGGSVGPKSQRAMAQFGALVTVALLINQRALFGVLTSKFGSSKPAPPPAHPAGNATVAVPRGH